VQIVLALLLPAAGCGTTRLTDTRRTATEQLLISDAIDQAVDQIDCTPLAGKEVYFSAASLTSAADSAYVASTIKQKLLATGCILKENRADAQYVVETRIGTVGTDSNRLVFGIPAVNVPPALTALGGTPAPIPTIPEVPLVKKSAQKGVAKLALFAYDQRAGRAYWQSGSVPAFSTAKDTWILGAGPFQWGSIHERPRFAGTSLPVPHALRRHRRSAESPDTVTVAAATVFDDPMDQVDGDVELVEYVEPVDEPPRKLDVNGSGVDSAKPIR